MILYSMDDFKYQAAPGHSGTVGGMRAESDFCMIEQSMMLPGAGSEFYKAQHDHFYLILEGSPTVYIKDENGVTEYQLHPLDVAKFQAGDEKRIENKTNEAVKMIVLIGK